MTHSTIALDIGGANLKAAHSNGVVLSRPFELWKNPGGLAMALRSLLDEMPDRVLLAVTMTGELCDCYESKREGVESILDAVATAAADLPTLVWQTDGTLVDSVQARTDPLRTAASNWLALATYVGRLVPSGPALLIDIGSTTTDIVPLLDGQPVPSGRTDPERLRLKELVYTGARRTPLCALLGGEGAAEWFATTLDLYLALGMIVGDVQDRSTADGRPATVTHAHARLARMLCADSESCTEGQTRLLAQQLCSRQTTLIDSAMATVAHRLPEMPRTLVLSGSGEFLARYVSASSPIFASTPIISLAESLGSEVSNAACAYALALLATEIRARR